MNNTFEIENGLLGLDRDAFLGIIEHMRFKDTNLLKNVNNYFFN
jgi:hypothetical protein